MRIRSTGGLLVGLAIVVGGGASCGWCSNGDETVEAVIERAVCDAKHGFLDLDDGDCPLAGCGMNGVWLGRGVSFRTLHIAPHIQNPEGLFSTGFTSATAESLQLDIARDSQILIGWTLGGHERSGSALNGARLRLANGKDDSNSYTLRIDEVIEDADFWAQCTPDCSRAPTHVQLYRFTAISDRDGCEVALCKPGIDDDPGSLQGTAVIFRGDYYDSDYTVRTSPNRDEIDVFNIACLGTAISKLHLFRHTTAGGPLGQPFSVDRRQAMMRMFAADYCGVGHVFTHDGVPLRLRLDGPYQPTQQSGFTLAPGNRPEALWTANGASCLGLPRLAQNDPAQAATLRNQVNAVCTANGRPALQDCGRIDLANPFANGGYAVSASP